MSEPTTPAPPPPATAPVPTGPPRRRRRWLPVFLVIIGLVVVLWIVGGVLFATRTLPPYQAADDFLDDVRSGRVTAAAAQLCDADSDDPDAAIETITRNFPGNDTIGVNPFGVDRDGDVATVDYTLSNEDTPDNDDDRKTYELRVVLEDGDWKPCPNPSAR